MDPAITFVDPFAEGACMIGPQPIGVEAVGIADRPFHRLLDDFMGGERLVDYVRHFTSTFISAVHSFCNQSIDSDKLTTGFQSVMTEHVFTAGLTHA
jgi:hypothetical protein